MSAPQYTSAADRWNAEQVKGPSMVDPTPFVGTWINTNDSARHKIARVVMSIRDGALLVHAYGDCSPDLCDWGEVVADVFAENISAHGAMSFTAGYDFGFLGNYLQLNLKTATPL